MTDQMMLFEAPAADDSFGYRAPAVQAIAGVTYRQLDYWARTGLIEPSVRAAAGSGSQRLYAFADIVIVKVVKRLLDAGISLQGIRKAVECLRALDTAESLSEITLVSDGVSIYACHGPDEVIDLLSGGQAVFGIAVGRAVTDVRGSVAEFPAESAAGVRVEESVVDELAARRAARAS